MLKSYEAVYDHGELEWVGDRPPDGRMKVIVTVIEHEERPPQAVVLELLDKTRGMCQTSKIGSRNRLRYPSHACRMGEGMGPLRQGSLLDSDILIYHINGQLDEPAERFLTGVWNGPVYISVISRMEVLGWKGHTDESWHMTNQFLMAFIEISLDEDVVQTTIRIRRSINIKLPDAMIAASALSRRLVLVTRNMDDFCRIPDLHVADPFDS